ncbi:MAG: cyclic nucleotide-binding domain-containing protein [Deltaproteobacteria bacterium]|nr:cyclic nucleotide-binding domain-containing protein [Deltaproteobacteria bacterium]
MDVATLGKIGFFADLKPAHLEVLAKNLRPLHMEAGELLIAEDAPTRAPLFVIDRGRLQVSRKDAAGHAHPIVTLEPPTVVGELEFLADVPSSASVMAVEELSGVLLPRERFQTLFEAGEAAAYALALSIGRLVSKRLAETNKLLIRALVTEPDRLKKTAGASANTAALAGVDAELDALLKGTSGR